jgi:hypothetical protein
MPSESFLFPAPSLSASNSVYYNGGNHKHGDLQKIRPGVIYRIIAALTTAGDDGDFPCSVEVPDMRTEDVE